MTGSVQTPLKRDRLGGGGSVVTFLILQMIHNKKSKVLNKRRVLRELKFSMLLMLDG